MAKYLIRSALMSLLLTVALVLPPRVASATTFFSGNTLYDYCKADPHDRVAYGTCVGYIAGVADAMETGPLYTWKACVPRSAAMGQPYDVVLRSLRAHPEWRHFTAPSLVAHALSEAFPCK